MKKLTRLSLVFFPIYGLALGITYSSEEQEEEEKQEEVLEYGDEHTVQFYLLVFGFSIIYSLK